MNGLGSLEAQFLRGLINGLLRQCHELLDIAHRALNIHRRNVKTKRGQLDCDDVISKGCLLAELVNAQRTPEKSERRTRWGGNEISLAIETPVEIRQQGMPSPTIHVRDMRLSVQIGQCAFGRAKMPLACIHRFVGIKGDRKHTGSPSECVATPKACRSRRIGRNLCTSQDLLHHIATESFGRMRDLYSLQNV
jgi:hypothetical protein